MNTTKKNTVTAKDAATRFFGKGCEKDDKKRQALRMFNDSMATNGHVIIKADNLPLDWSWNVDAYGEGPSAEIVEEVIKPYLVRASAARVPAPISSHMAVNIATHWKGSFGLAFCGRWCAYYTHYDGSSFTEGEGPATFQDGATIDDRWGVRDGFGYEFDSEIVAKIYRAFKVVSVDAVSYDDKKKTNGFLRFNVIFKGAPFTVVLLQKYEGVDAETALELAEQWEREDAAKFVKAAKAA